MSISLNQWGNSLGIRLPKHILDKYKLVNGSSLEIHRHDIIFLDLDPKSGTEIKFDEYL